MIIKPTEMHARALHSSPIGPTTGDQDRHPLRRIEDREFTKMQRIYSGAGGVVTGDQLAELLRRRAAQPISVLARWVVARHVVSFSWRSQLMVPLFQFDMCAMELLPYMSPALRELTEVFDDWDVAVWFATPNAWTGDLAPAEAIHKDGRSVLDAARGDRFLVRG
jgi:hypothetical protein